MTLHRVFHSREYLALFSITRHKFLPFRSTVRLCWTSSKGTEPTHQSSNVVLISTCTYTHEMRCSCAYAMQCTISCQFHMENLSYTFNHVSWTIILHAYNFQNNHSFQCRYISIHISTFIKQQLSSMLLPIK